MIHGYLSSSHFFSHLIPFFKEDYTVTTIDLPGSGRSTVKTSTIDYDYYVESLHESLRQANLQKPYALLGHSMGACIAIEYALRYPDEVKELILCNPPLFKNADDAHASLSSTGAHYRTFLWSRYRHVLWPLLRVTHKLTSSRGPKARFKVMVSTHKLAREGGMRHIIMSGRALSDLPRLTIPTLLLMATHDRRVYFDNLKNIELPSNITIQTMPGGHRGPSTLPEEYAKTIRRHLL